MSLIFSLSFRFLHAVACLTSQFGSQKCLGFNSSKTRQRSSAVWAWSNTSSPQMWSELLPQLVSSNALLTFLNLISTATKGSFQNANMIVLPLTYSTWVTFLCSSSTDQNPHCDPQNLDSCHAPHALHPNHTTYLDVASLVLCDQAIVLPILFTVLAPCFYFL